MEKKLRIHTETGQRYQVRYETLQGRNHLVVPVVMMVEGVHAGSRGPVLHLAEEFENFTPAWNGIPVTIDHPKRDGQFVSANDPEMIETSTVGRVFNTHVDGEKLKAEAWLDQEKLKEVSPEALSHIDGGKELDVSVGVFTEDDNTPGNWNGEAYESIARNYRPDHLALLPGGVGACSWEDGCGVRANEKNEGGTDVKQDVFKNKEDLVAFATGYKELIDRARQKLDAMDTNTRVHLLEEVFEDHLIYRVATAEGEESFYRREYSINEDGSIELEGEPQPVEKRTEFVALSDGGQKEEKQMFNLKKFFGMGKKKDETVSTCVKNKVQELINHEGTRFTDDDREWLEGLGDVEVLERLFPVEQKKQEGDEPAANSDEGGKEDNRKVTKEEAMEALQGLSQDEFMKFLPKEVREQIEHGLSIHRAEREKKIDHIMNNTPEGTWERKTLEAMETKTLESLAASVKPKADYSLNSASNEAGSEPEDKLLPLGVKEKKEEK